MPERNVPVDRRDGPHWDYTQSAEDLHRRGDPRFEEPDAEAPHGWYLGRRIIARDTPINGGVYIVPGIQEAIVVDDSKFTRDFEWVYSSLLAHIYKVAGHNPRASVLRKVLIPVFATVERAIPYNLDLAETVADTMHDNKVNLGLFISARGGVCRHQALLAAYLIERLKRDRELSPKDKISIDRNVIPGRGGHAWDRYTSSDGTVYILDPAQKVVDRLSNLDSSTYWNYRRPGDN